MTTNNKRLKKWVDDMAKMCTPDKVVWIDGSEQEKARLTKEALATGEVIELNLDASITGPHSMM